MGKKDWESNPPQPMWMQLEFVQHRFLKDYTRWSEWKRHMFEYALRKLVWAVNL